MSKEAAVKSQVRTPEKNGGWKSHSDHVRSSPSVRPAPRIVTPLSIFKRRSKAAKNKVADNSDTEGDHVVSSMQADDDSTRSSIRSFRLGIKRGTYSPPTEDVPLTEKSEAVTVTPPPTKPVAAATSDATHRFDRFRPRLDEDSSRNVGFQDYSPKLSQRMPPLSSPSADARRSIALEPISPPRTERRSLVVAPRDHKARIPQLPSPTTPIRPKVEIAPGQVSPPRAERRFSCPSSLTTSTKKTKKKANYDSDQAQPGSGIRLSKPIKIFLLLLQPKSKIFELIRIACHPQGTTVNGILSMIPLSATEPALGSPEYIGLCRPTDGCDVTSSDGYVQVTRGEILVAIPKGYNGSTVAPIGMRILSNPKIVKLLKRSEQSSRRHRSTFRRERVGTVPENEVFNGDDSTVASTSSEMKIVMKKAAKLAAAANADVVTRSQSPSTPRKKNTFQEKSRSSHENPFESKSMWSSVKTYSEGTQSLGSMRHSIDRTISEDSVEDSYSTWSKSLDYSFTGPSSVTGSTRSQSSSLRRRHRRTRRLSYTKNAVVATLSMMIAWYCSDPRGRGNFVDEATANPMGLAGLIQTVMLFWSIYKAQKWIRRSRIVADSRDRCPFLRASTDALQRVNHHQHSTSRSFSGFP